jgi:hypothetical protein
MLKRRSRENESSPKKAKVQRVLDFLLDDNPEDNAQSEITAFMRERADPDTDSLVWWKDIPINIQDSRFLRAGI